MVFPVASPDNVNISPIWIGTFIHVRPFSFSKFDADDEAVFDTTAGQLSNNREYLLCPKHRQNKTTCDNFGAETGNVRLLVSIDQSLLHIVVLFLVDDCVLK